MKKKLLITFLALACAGASAFGLAACSSSTGGSKDEGGGSGEGETHVHTYSNEWTSDTQYHWHAATCEHTDEVSGKAEHTWDDGVISVQPTCTNAGEKTSTCTVCGKTKTETVEKTEHVWNDGEITAQPTCTEKGEKTYTCTLCGETKTETVAATGHTLTYVEAKTATCTEDGNIEYWICSVCEKNFTDSDGKNEVTDTVIPATGHIWVDGVCSVCNTERVSAGLEYTLLSDGLSYCVSEGTCTDSEIIIPSTHNELPVTSIGGFSRCLSLTSITIPESVTSIGDYAFYNCTALTNIKLPNGLTSIGEYAFNNCTALTSIKLPNGLTSISWGTFYDCSSLTSITIPESVTNIENYAFYGCTALSEINYNATDCADFTYDNYIFYCAGQNGDGITVNIGANVKKIPAQIFRPRQNSFGEPKLICVNFEENSVCESIGTYAFHDCFSLKSINMPSSVTSIGDEAFRMCISLTSITIPENVESIGEQAFVDCVKLIEVYNLSSLDITANSSNFGCVASYALNVYTPTSGESKLNTVDNKYIFYENGDTVYLMRYTGEDTNLKLPDTYNNKNYEIYPYAFYGCTTLTSITIPDGVTGIGTSAFWYCTSLVNASIGSGVTSIGKLIFAACTMLESITVDTNNTAYSSQDGILYNKEKNQMLQVPQAIKGTIVLPIGLNTIYSYAFQDCSGITSITIPASITSIGSYAFDGCTSLTEINYYATECNDIDNNGAFKCAGQNGDGITVNIGYNVKKIPANLFGQYNSDYSPKIVTVNFEYGSMCESIGAEAFRGCVSLKSFIIPDKVTNIGISAFKGCSQLENINIPRNVTTIGISAFSKCSSLTEITVSTGNMNYCAIDGVLFNIDKTSLICYPAGKTTNSYTIPDSVTNIGDYAFCYCTILTSVTIPDGVTSIGNYAFYSCYELTSITIPDSMTSIDNYAFDSCSELTSIYYYGTEEDWTNISIGSNNKYLTAATRYYYSESEPTTIADGTAYDGNFWHYVDGEIVIWVKE